MAKTNSRSGKKTNRKENKPSKNKYLKYSQQSLSDALDAVSKGLSIRTASKKFHVPFSTIRCKVKGIYPIGKRSGPSTILTTEEEQKLIEWILFVSSKGFLSTKDMLLDSVELLIKELKRENPFKNGRPGRHWFEAFLKRHPQLSLRISQNLCERRAPVTEEKMHSWFQEIEDYLRSKNLLNIDRSRVFNCDEAAFFLNPRGNKVITNRKSKSVYNLVGVNDKENLITVLITGNAAGQIVSPMVMFSYQRLPAIIIKSMPSGWSIGRSDNGWITGESFYEYMTNIFYPWCLQNGIQFPVIMYLDGHSSHITMALSDFCRAHEIKLISLYPHSTDITQPVDVGLFRPLKDAWKKAVCNWRTQNNSTAVKKSDFAQLLKVAMESINTEESLSNGFTCCGLAPLLAINYKKLLNTNQTTQDEDINEEDSTTTENEEHKCTLKFIENFVDMDTLQLFMITEKRNEEWHGEEKYRELFTLWLKCRRLLK